MNQIYVSPPHPAALPEELLLKQCELTTGRVSGPGGQHRNRVDTAVFIKHIPTEIIAQGTERRSQRDNRRTALTRLRLKLAMRVRTKMRVADYEPSPLWKSRRQGKQMSINPNHEDYPVLLAEALNVIVAARFDVAGSAGQLGITMSQLAKLVRHQRHAFAFVNEGRVDRGLPALK